MDGIKASVPYAFVGGPFGSNLTTRDYIDEGVPVIRGNNLPADAAFLDDDFAFVSETKADNLRSNTAYPGDLVFTQRGTLGQVGIIPREARFQRYIISQSQMKLTVDTQLADSRFVYYFFRLPATVQSVINHAATSGVPHINLGTLKDFNITLPDLTAQQRIATVLSAYDDLMENNRRRMGLLEKVARLMYQEWFVRLRFPGHEHTVIKDGIPQGWTTCALDDLCLVGRGASPRPIADFMGGEVPWFRIADATASESPYIFQAAEHVTDDGAKKSIMLEPGALILSNSATCGIPNFTGVRGCIHDGWLHFANLKRISLQFLYCYFHGKRDELVSSVSDGSTQKNLNTAAVGRLKVVLPPQDVLLAQFDQSVEPMFKMIFNLARQNISLRAARDLLLPRFMSGEITV
jgi:type I restriction enzyme S subunit